MAASGPNTASNPGLLSFLTHGIAARVAKCLQQLENAYSCPDTLTILYHDVELDAVLLGMAQARSHQCQPLDSALSHLEASAAATKG
ncbi:MAG: hypothetical protein VKJ06_06705 [Vampirovibrionales bacterium]|nr:hypothetical protein [Vampirovibrionales bacterium]